MSKMRVTATAWSNITYRFNKTVEFDSEIDDPWDIAVDTLLHDIELDYEIIEEDCE